MNMMLSLGLSPFRRDTAPIDAPVIDAATLPTGQVSVPYGALLTATGTPPITWSVASGALPAGLELAPDGSISGTPSEPTPGASFTARADNAAGFDESEFQIEVVE